MTNLFRILPGIGLFGAALGAVGAAKIDFDTGQGYLVRIAQWLPWVKMGSRAGLMHINAVGKNLGSWDDLPVLLRDEIKTNYPVYTPPYGDTRKNETSWTYFKKYIDRKKPE